MGDLRHALRSLRKQPAFSAVAALTLAFGIAVNVTLFSMISAFFLQPLPVYESHRLVIVMQRGAALNMPIGHSYPDYLDYREGTKVFSHLAAYMPTPAHLAASGRAPERTWIEIVSPEYFTIAGVSPALGEFPQRASDGRKGAPPVVVLSYRYWERHFGSDPRIVGQLVTLNGRPFTVAAVAPKTFTGLSWALAVSAFVPAGAAGALLENGEGLLDSRGSKPWRLMGRLADGRTLEDAKAEIELIAARLAAQYPAEHKDTRVMVIPENRSRPDPTIAGFLPIFAAVFTAMAGLVLLIACANVANLLFARAVERQRDAVVRAALGASRFQLIRLHVVESFVLAALAGCLGILLAQWAGAALAAATPTGEVPINDEFAPDWRILPFTVALSAAAGLLSGLWPALQGTRFNLVDALKSGGSTVTRSRHPLRNLLVIGQVTLSLVVLVSGALFLQSLRQMKKADIGFAADHLYMMSVDLGLQRYSDSQGLRFADELLARVEALPGVVSASVASHVPFDTAMQFAEVTRPDRIAGAQDGSLSVGYTVVESDFFQTLGVSIARGRGFDARDVDRSPRVAVVNETLADILWSGDDPVGKHFAFGRRGVPIEVVGVARNGRYVMLAEANLPYFYLPLAQHYQSPLSVLVRTESEPASIANPVRRVVHELDPALPVFNARTMDRHLRDSVFGLMPVRIGAAMAAVQGAIALLLTVMGLYAVVANTVTRRLREIGVRIALGAEPADVLRLVVRDGMWLTGTGIAIGWLLSVVLGLVMSKILYGLGSFDVAVFAGVTVLVLLVSGAACYLPARRATRIDPLLSLRAE